MATLLPIVLLLANADLTGSVRMEAQAGEAPTITNPVSSFYEAALLRPDITLQLSSPTTETRVFEALRLFLRRPKITNREGPLYLNMLQAEHTGHSGERLKWAFRLNSTAGEVDYVALSQVLGQQATLPDTLNIFTADASGSIGYRLTRQWRLDSQVAVLRRQTWGSTQPAGTSAPPVGSPPAGASLPTETDASLEPRLEFAMSRRQIGQLRVKFTHYDLAGSTQLEATEVEARLGWRYQLARHHELQLEAGIAVASAPQPSDPTRPWTSLSPLAKVLLASSLPLTPTTFLRSRASGEVLWYLDPVLGVALPRGQIDANLAIEVNPSWMFEVYVQAATDISRHPLPDSPIETFISAGAPLRYRVNRNWLVELGGRYSQRGPHLTAPDFSLGQTELLGYLAVTATTR